MRKLTLASFRPTPAILFLAFGTAIVACDSGPENTGGTGNAGASGATAAKGGSDAKGGTGGAVSKGGAGGGISKGGAGGSGGAGGGVAKGGSGGGTTGGGGGAGGGVAKGGSGGVGGGEGGTGGTVSKGGAGGGVGKGGAGGGTAGAGGTTGKFCGGFGGFECGKGQFCNLEGAACGAADAGGVCEDMPKFCPDGCSKQGACGCDGKIYCNECEANRQGVSLAPASFCEGTPPEPKRACGTKGTKACFPGEFCDRSGSKTCGEADEPGVCKKLPGGCTEQCEFPGACGCDGKRHCSACQAEASGVSVAPNDSYCPPIVDPGERACGSKGTMPCFPNEFCDRSESKTCGEADEPGKCKPLPAVCSKECSIPGVCGCDGQRHCSACQAQLSGVSVAPSESYCKPVDPQPGKACGGFIGATCDKGEYCLFAPEAGCGFADGAGTCTPKPEKCTTQCDFAPLCGCDGQLYCNSCAIAANGVSQAPDFSYCKK